MQKEANGHLVWAKKRDFIIPSEEELKKMVLPENVSFRFHISILFLIIIFFIFYDSTMTINLDSHDFSLI